MSDLLFEFTSSTTDLLFGEDAPVAPAIPLTFNAVLPALTFSAKAIPNVNATLVATLPAMTLAATIEYVSHAERPTVSAAASDWQDADGAQSSAGDTALMAVPTPTQTATPWTPADKLVAQVSPGHDSSTPLRNVAASRFSEANALRASTTGSHQDTLRLATSRRATHDNAVRVGQSRTAQHQDGYRDRRAWRKSQFSGADSVKRSWSWGATSGDEFNLWNTSVGQNAMRPSPGISSWGPVVPPGTSCYTPSPHLLFAQQADGTSLLFICDNEPDTPTPPGGLVVVPVRSVYMVINDVSLTRVSNNLELPTISISLKIDSGSWTWGFDATLPASSLSDLEPNVLGDPVELEVMVNGSAYRVLAESLTRERTFGQATIRVSGRGKSAFLDSPYAPILSFSNDNPRTAQQLMNDVLTINNVSLGWDVDWRLTDWTVPAGVWSHQGSYISALKVIAESAGGYLQPHPTNSIMRVMPKYATAPWNWNSVTPDFELPSDLTTREGIDWKESARYNRVFVSGQQQGVMGQVTRLGTAGDVVAPMVVDSLITHADAARQRGIAILGDTGRQAFVTLRIPVLAETGIIEPGKFIQYNDAGVTRRGVVRSTDIAVGFPDVFQSLGVETHA